MHLKSARFKTHTFFPPPRSSESGSTLRVFLPPLKTAAQRTCRPVPPPPCKCLLLNHVSLGRRPFADRRLRVHRQTQPLRNIAEELDPTFQAGRRGPDGGGSGLSGSVHSGQSEPWMAIAQNSLPLLPNAGSGGQPLPVTSSGMRDLREEPSFIPPTKRQTDKAARSKPKEKKENCKQQ